MKSNDGQSKRKTSCSIAVVGLVLTVLVFLFGNNVFQQIFGKSFYSFVTECMVGTKTSIPTISTFTPSISSTFTSTEPAQPLATMTPEITLTPTIEYLPTSSDLLHLPIPNIIYRRYDDARIYLINSGWQPDMNGYVRPESEMFGNTEVFVAEKYYWELVHCSGTGLAYCWFSFTDVYGNKLMVRTGGMEVPEKDIHAIVGKFYLGDSMK